MSETHEFFKVPDLCPVCSGTLKEEGDFLFCRSKACPSGLAGSVKVWIKRLGLLHWGTSMVDALTDPNNLRILSVGDLYRLDVETIAECCSGMKLAQKCFDVLHSRKRISLEVLLASLNIPLLALSTATDIVRSGIDTVEKVLDVTYEDLIKVPNVGEKTAAAILDGINEKRHVIADLAAALTIIPSSSGPLSGFTLCVTGTTSRPRKSIQLDIVAAGGVVKDSVGKEVTHLVTNEGQDFGSKKMLAALKNGTKVISEDALYGMIHPSTS